MEIHLGGEAEVKIYEDFVVKKRVPKRYRIRELDEELRIKRTKIEAKIMSLARRVGVPTPIIFDVEGDTIVMERIKGENAKNCMSADLSREVGKLLAKMHSKDIIHGDVTPSNMIVSNKKIYFIDFGLSYIDHEIESKGVDVHVYFEALKAGFDNWEELQKSFVEGYLESGGSLEVIERAREIEERGRYVERRG
ncbi:MAG: Kae1-associated kinase Bud32 [Archaeoglobaceae archaeon]